MILFNASPVSTVDQHKHLGIMLYSKLSFSAHIQAAINKSRKAIGMLKFMSKYLTRNTLNELYKLYVRPHLDYGDVIYHIQQGMDCSENYMIQKLESVQYSAAIAVTGTWRGTSQERLYNELGSESFSSRRWSRRLTLLYKFINNLTPDYTRDPIPLLQENNYRFRNPPVVGQMKARTEKFKSSFYPHSLSEWNKLDPEIRETSSVSVLKTKSFSQIRYPANFVHGIHNPKGIASLTQLRMGLSKLNFHKFNIILKIQSIQCAQLTME